MVIQIVFLILIVCNIFDFMFTEILLSKGAYEINPFIDLIINRYGHFGFLVVKEIVVIALLCCLMSDKIITLFNEDRILKNMIILVTVIYIILVQYQGLLLLI